MPCDTETKYGNSPRRETERACVRAGVAAVTHQDVSVDSISRGNTTRLATSILLFFLKELCYFSPSSARSTLGIRSKSNPLSLAVETSHL